MLKLNQFKKEIISRREKGLSPLAIEIELRDRYGIERDLTWIVYLHVMDELKESDPEWKKYQLTMKICNGIIYSCLIGVGYCLSSLIHLYA